MVYFPTFTIRINHIYTTPIGVIHIPTRKVTQVTLSVPSFPWLSLGSNPPPTQYSSHHQVDITFVCRKSLISLYLPLLLGGGGSKLSLILKYRVMQRWPSASECAKRFSKPKVWYDHICFFEDKGAVEFHVVVYIFCCIENTEFIWNYTKKHHMYLLLMEEILHQWLDSLSHDLQGLIHSSWLVLESVSTISLQEVFVFFWIGLTCLTTYMYHQLN